MTPYIIAGACIGFIILSFMIAITARALARRLGINLHSQDKSSYKLFGFDIIHIFQFMNTFPYLNFYALVGLFISVVWITVNFIGYLFS